MDSLQYKQLLELISGGINAKSEVAIGRLFDFAQDLLHFQSAIAASFRLSDNGISIQKVINHSYDNKWVDTYIGEKFAKVDPVIRYSLSTSTPFRWSDAFNSVDCPPSFFTAASDFGLQSGSSFALRSHEDSSSCDIISFSNVDERLIEDGVFILKILVPVFREIIANSGMASATTEELPKLTSKEQEVLAWAMEGKSIWDIAQILNITERTVKFHLQNVYKKLDVLNRAQAVAKAMKYGMV